jgi:sugar phosphate isomerase/epimerase
MTTLIQRGVNQMIQLGVNSVLFKHYSFAQAAEAIAKCGYDGVEISAISGMCEHLQPDNWRKQKKEIKSILEATGLKILSSEVASQDPKRLKHAFEAAQYFGIPVINIGPGGKSNVEEDFLACVERLNKLSEIAAKYKVTLCCKAHVGGAIFNTPTTLRAMELVNNAYFGIDMDPSHIYRAGEKPEDALASVLPRMKHIHIRDCKGNGPSPGIPSLQTCGRGDINLYGYIKAMVNAGYDGPVCLEVIGPEQDIVEATRIASESYGYMNACLKMLNAR